MRPESPKDEAEGSSTLVLTVNGRVSGRLSVEAGAGMRGGGTPKKERIGPDRGGQASMPPWQGGGVVSVGGVVPSRV